MKLGAKKPSHPLIMYLCERCQWCAARRAKQSLMVGKLHPPTGLPLPPDPLPSALLRFVKTAV